MRQAGSVLWPKLRVLQLYGANTGVGKTIFSTLLGRAFKRRIPTVNYLKPISTGPLAEADDRHVSKYGLFDRSDCLYQFSEPVSPHIAAELDGSVPSDAAIQIAIQDRLRVHTGNQDAVTIVETAGGVLSPSPSKRSQADLYRPLRLPVVLVGDHRLGGIGTTISAWESLHVRGYDVQSLVMFEGERYGNARYLKDYFAERGVHVFSAQQPPEPEVDEQREAKQMQAYYEKGSESAGISQCVDRSLALHDQRIKDLEAMPAKANDIIWHPFMQHSERSKDTILAIDSAYGDYFATLTPKDPDGSLLKPAFDASASWWTQGLGHGNPQLALTAAHAAGRYGHVMFAGAIHEPALTLAQTLVEKSGNPRLDKVFFSDDGSTGMEVAVKMALRAAAVRNEWSSENSDITILGLTNSYHGDTIGVMDCSEPSIFNKKVEWYSGRGDFLDPPVVNMKKGEWVVEAPESAGSSLRERRRFGSLDEIFHFEGREGDRRRYREFLDAELTRLRNEGHRLGALILEPVILGAGGMLFVDPLFQRCLVDAVREMGGSRDNPLEWSGMPVIFDEVFTGLYRLGRFSAASFLGVDADIVVNAKLLTGGLLPLCTTTASRDVFDAFLSKDKSDALLHGHSYTAHAVGCEVANESLKTMGKIDTDGSWDDFRSDWGSEPSGAPSGQLTAPQPTCWSMWSQAFVTSLSMSDKIDHVFAIGSVLAVSIKDPGGQGYASTAAVDLRDQLLQSPPDEDWAIHSRVLGNVIYFMAAMNTPAERLRGIERRVADAVGLDHRR